ncbi:hypothetical protein GF323_07050 [Candidatus Woesearchaeota archaeon]|nr:hypothetical protein [Candidatus Woesearchaeota archaeon]
MKLKTLSIMFIIAIFILSGCTQEDDSGIKTKDPFIGGTEAVLISFLEDAPLPEVRAGGDFPFDVVVRLKNEGEHAIPKDELTVTISGINAQEFNKEESELVKSPEEDLDARRKENSDIIDSNPVFVEYQDFNRAEDFSGNTYTIRADVCYGYATEAVSTICIKSNNLDDKEGVCTVNEDKQVHSSGAPVKMENMKETATAKNKVRFSFDIVHKGNGRIYKKDSDCGKEDRRANEDKVWVEVSTGLEGLECTGLSGGTGNSGFATLYSGDKRITCTQTVDTTSDYEKTVEITVEYEYEDNAETSVTVLSAAGN